MGFPLKISLDPDHVVSSSSISLANPGFTVRPVQSSYLVEAHVMTSTRIKSKLDVGQEGEGREL